MTGRHKFAELEAGMTPERRACIDKIAERLGCDIDQLQLRAAKQSKGPSRTADRDTYCYLLIANGKIVHCGITTDPRRRLMEHRKRWPGATVEVVGPAGTREAARQRRTALKLDAIAG
jgi:hypothetical protein